MLLIKKQIWFKQDALDVGGKIIDSAGAIDE